MRRHLLICAALLFLALPVFIVDNLLLKPGSGDFIAGMDLRGMFISAYLIFLGIHFSLSTLAFFYFRKANLLALHGGAALLQLALIGMGLVIWG